MNIFKGSATALITPFKDDLSVDYDSLKNLIDFQLGNKTDAIVICGTTGEAPTLEDDEHLNIIKECVKYVDNRVPVIAGTGSNNTNHAIYMSKEAEKLGVDGLLLVTPYYNKATQKGLKMHYSEIAKSVKIPALMYNVPSRTGCNIEPLTAIEIVENNKNIVGIKEASGNSKQIKELKELSKLLKVKVDIYAGNDEEVINVLKNEGCGVISVCSNITPKRTHDIVENYMNNDVNCFLLQEYQNELSKVLFSEVNPIPIKEACHQLGLIRTNKLRLPLTNISEFNKKKLVKVLKKQNLL